MIEPHLLIVDADTPNRMTLAHALAQKYTVHQAVSGQDALQQLAAQSFVVMVLDPVRLGMNEAELMRRARDVDRSVLFIILTAHPTIDSTIAAIRANVFDYLLKPCVETDVIRSIERALESRAKQTRQDRLLSMVHQVLSELDGDTQEPALVEPAPIKLPTGVALDREKRMVTLQTTPPQQVELTEGEVALLGAMMEKPNRVLTCAQLAQLALGYNGMDKWTVESVIRSSIFRLRQKLEPTPDTPKVIHTVRGRGYYYATG